MALSFSNRSLEKKMHSVFWASPEAISLARVLQLGAPHKPQLSPGNVLITTSASFTRLMRSFRSPISPLMGRGRIGALT